MKKGLSDAFKIYHTAQVRVLYADTDKMGIVYNGNYLKYFENYILLSKIHLVLHVIFKICLATF